LPLALSPIPSPTSSRPADVRFSNDDNSPKDCGDPCFGSGNLIGKPFTFTLAMSVPSGMTSGQIRAATTRPTAAQSR